MEDSIYTTQPRIACWIDEEGRNEVDLDFMCLGGLPDSLFSMAVGLLGKRVPVLPGPRSIPS
jgi:hypothetical protein